MEQSMERGNISRAVSSSKMREFERTSPITVSRAEMDRLGTMLNSGPDAILQASNAIVDFCTQNRANQARIGTYADGMILTRLHSSLEDSSVKVKVSVLKAFGCLAEVIAVSNLIGEQGSLPKLQDLSRHGNRTIQQAANDTLRVLAKSAANRCELAELIVAPHLAQLCELVQVTPPTPPTLHLLGSNHALLTPCKQFGGLFRSLKLAVAAGVA
jgi:hypothetical protein